MKPFRIFYTTDTHGYLFPTDYTDREEKPVGLLKLAADFEQDGNTLILDGGDTLQGSPFTGYLQRNPARPHPLAKLMNLVGYQYVTLGNHDFNYGLDVLGEFLNGLDAVCLCANIRDRAGKLPVRDWAIHTLANGVRVGITGVCTHYVTYWEKKETLDQLVIEEPIPAAKKALEAMRGQVDYTICLYHGGFERDLTTGALLTQSAENQACLLCDECDFDLVLTGHQHMDVEQVRLNRSVAAQTGYRAKHYVRADVDESGTRTTLCAPGARPLENGKALLQPIEDRVQAWLDTPIGHLDAALTAGDHLRMALNGSTLANFINQVQLDVSGADISTTSLGNEIKGMDPTVTVRDVVSSYIYSNTLVLLEMTGAQLKKYMERSAEYFDRRDGQTVVSEDFLKPKVEHYNYDYFSGVDYEIDPSRPKGSRVVSVRFRGTEIAPEQTLRVCVNNYRASGSGGYEMVREAKVLREIQQDVSELIIAYIEQRGDVKVDSRRWLTVV